MEKLACVILAAGKGSRMKSSTPKVLHRLAGAPMIQYVIQAASTLGAENIITVIAPDMENTVGKAVAPHKVAIQKTQRGTADALLAAQDQLKDFKGKVLVLLGDAPLVNPDTLQEMIDLFDHAAEKPGVVLLTMRPTDPGAFGRVILKDGQVEKIVEYADATEAERAIDLCSSGVMLFDGADLWKWMGEIGNDNAQGEYYLPDIIGIIRKNGRKALVVEGDATECLGINTKEELAAMEYRVQQMIRYAMMEDGVQMVDPETVYFSYDTKIAQDVLIEPNVFFGLNVEVEEGVTIKAFSHLEGCLVRQRAVIGPFARLRPGVTVGEECKIGNFVEAKKASFGKGSKANHLSYIGDADIGEGVNIGAGTITCNYDGYLKYRTQIGDGAFIGSNTSLVAPVSVGAGAIVGAGSTIAEDVAEDMLVLTRAHRVERAGWAKSFRERKTEEKKQANS